MARGRVRFAASHPWFFAMPHTYESAAEGKGLRIAVLLARWYPELTDRLLEEIRYELNVDRLHAAAIERGARARHVT